MLIVFGIIYIINESDGVNVFGDVFSLGALAISVGVIIFFIAALGCCGALHENSCLLTTVGKQGNKVLKNLIVTF